MPDSYEGHGDTYEKALHDAYDKAKKHGHGPGWYTVVETHVKFENPISDYRIVISPSA
jgi:hypothetical protein